MKAAFFQTHFRGAWLHALEGSSISLLAKVAELGSPSFGDSLRDFVLEVSRIKALARGS